MNEEDQIVVINGVEVDARRANIIMQRLIVLETENSKSKKYNDNEIIKKIMHYIEEEVNCY